MSNKTMFGFRLDRVTLNHGLTRQGQDFATTKLETPQGETFVQTLESMRSRIVGVTRVGNLKYVPSEADQEGINEGGSIPTLRVERMTINRSRIDFVIRVGRQGSHDLAITADASEDVGLEDKASTNPFHVSLYLPTTGSEAVLVSEVRSRTSAGSQLMKLIGVLSFESAFSNQNDDNDQWWRLTSNRHHWSLSSF